MMNRRIYLILLALFAATTVSAQNDTSGYVMVDSVYQVPSPMLDSTFFGGNIFSAMPKDGASSVHIYQSRILHDAFDGVIQKNPSRKMTGYRIRLYFDNSKDARVASQSMCSSFSASHPGVGVYRVYEAPFFKVTVGDFRSRSDAQAFLKSIKGKYPGAFIVKETIQLPPVYPDRPFVNDTVRVMKKQQP